MPQNWNSLSKKLLIIFMCPFWAYFQNALKRVLIFTSQQKAWGELEKPHLQQWESLRIFAIFFMLTIMIPC